MWNRVASSAIHGLGGGAQPYRLLAGEEVVLGVAGRAGGGRERVQDAVDVEQE
jgi:hypothetical protein